MADNRWFTPLNYVRVRNANPLRSRPGCLPNASRKEWAILLALVVFFLFAVSDLLCNVGSALEHGWRTIGPDSDIYEQCWAKIEAAESNYEIQEITKSGSGDEVVFRWEGWAMTADNSPAYSPTFLCRPTDAGVEITRE